jgi:hypothetical protein
VKRIAGVLKRTFNTSMRKARVERNVIMKITGHKTISISMLERSNTGDRDGAHEALKRLDDYLTKPHCGVKLLDYYFKPLNMKSFDPLTL